MYFHARFKSIIVYYTCMKTFKAVFIPVCVFVQLFQFIMVCMEFMNYKPDITNSVSPREKEDGGLMKVCVLYTYP